VIKIVKSKANPAASAGKYSLAIGYFKESWDIIQRSEYKDDERLANLKKQVHSLFMQVETARYENFRNRLSGYASDIEGYNKTKENEKAATMRQKATADAEKMFAEEPKYKDKTEIKKLLARINATAAGFADTKLTNYKKIVMKKGLFSRGYYFDNRLLFWASSFADVYHKYSCKEALNYFYKFRVCSLTGLFLVLPSDIFLAIGSFKIINGTTTKAWNIVTVANAGVFSIGLILSFLSRKMIKKSVKIFNSRCSSGYNVNIMNNKLELTKLFYF